MLTDAAKASGLDLRDWSMNEPSPALPDRWDASTAKSATSSMTTMCSAAARRAASRGPGTAGQTGGPGGGQAKQAPAGRANSSARSALEHSRWRADQPHVAGGATRLEVRQPPLKRSARSTPAWGSCVTPKFEVRQIGLLWALHRESGPKTNELIEKSLGRIISWTEFYSLIRERHQDGTPDMIGMEANQLIPIGNTPIRLCFIGAGYEDRWMNSSP